MSEVNAESGTIVDESVNTEQPEQIEVNRTAEEYARRVKQLANENEKRKHRERELQAKLDQFEKQQLEAQGKFQEIADKERRRALELEEQLKKTQARYAYQSVTSQIESEAIKAGCIDTKALLKLIDLEQLEVDDDFKVDQESVKQMLTREAKERSYLFQKSAPNVKDLPPKGGSQYGKKDLRKMTLAEKMDLLRDTMMSQKK